MEWWEGRRGHGSTTPLARGGTELSEAAAGWDHTTRGGFTGAAGEGGKRDGERKRVGRGAVRAQN